VVIRLDGLYGNAAPLTDVLDTGLGVVARSKEYTLLDRAEVKARLTGPADGECTHPESGASRALYDCPDIPLAPEGPRVRLLVATHPATSTPHKIGKKRDGVIYEMFITRLPAPAFSAKDVLDFYLHRGSFETVLADEDSEQDPDRWCSHTPCGQEFWQILSQWVWNLRLEIGPHFSPAAMRTTAFAPAFATEPAPPVPVSEPAPVLRYGPPQWAQRSFTGGFPGTAFPLQPDGNLLCPANHPLSLHKSEEPSAMAPIVWCMQPASAIVALVNFVPPAWKAGRRKSHDALALCSGRSLPTRRFLLHRFSHHLSPPCVAQCGWRRLAALPHPAHLAGRSAIRKSGADDGSSTNATAD
jgi:hypothetical protein